MVRYKADLSILFLAVHLVAVYHMLLFLKMKTKTKVHGGRIVVVLVHFMPYYQ